tara:strand:+ start:35 stop:2776 length:2742 start_codon:yes stop_codon:yes gene_type:complete
MAEDQAPSFSKGQIQDVLNTRDALKEIQKSMISVNKENKEFNKDFSQIYRSADNFAKAQETARKNTKSNNQLIREGNNLIGQSSKLLAQVSINETKRRNILTEINKIHAKAAKDDKELTVSQKNKIRLLGIEVGELQSKSQHLADAANHAKTLGGTYKTLSNESMSMSRNIYGTLGGLSKMLKLDENLTDGFTKANELQRERKMIALEEADLQDRMNKALVDYNKELAKKGKNPVSEKDFKKGKGMTKERLSKFGLDRYTEGRTGVGAGANIKKAKTGMGNTKSALGPMKALMKGVGAALKVFGKSMIALKAIGKIVEFIEYAFLGAEGEAVDLARSMNMGREAGFQMREDMMKMTESMSQLGTGLPSLVKFQLAYTKSTGTAARLNADQLETSMLLTKQMGFSNDEAIHLVENFKAAGMGAREGLDALRGSYIQLKDSNKTAMNFNQLMRDITGDTELQYIFQTKGADAAMRNAVAVRRTGLSLSQQRSMAEGTLDFEKTMADQLELQMLTGKKINMNKAQELALQGKNGAAVAEMQKQLGQLTAEQRKNPLIMNKMLSMLGMSREEYMKMQNAVREQKKLEAAQNKAKAHFNANEGKYFAEVAAFAKKDALETGKNYKQGLAYIKSLDKEKFKAAQEEMELIKEKMEVEDYAAYEKMSAEERNQAAFKQYHDTNLTNARIRAGVQTGEIKLLETQMTAGEAFNEAMEQLKTQFSKLVGSGAVEKLTTGLIDFVERASAVGFIRAAFGGGEKQAAETRATELSTNKELTPGDKLLVDKLMEQRKFYTRTGVTRDRQEAAKIRKDADRQLAGLSNIYNDPRQRQQRIREQNAAAQLETPPAIVEDFIMRPGQAPIKYNKGDLIMGGTQLDKSNGKVEQLLEELLAETKAGKIIKMDTATVGRSLQLNKSKMNY